MDIVFLIIGLLAGVAAGFFIAKYKFQRAENVSADEYEGLKSNLNALTAEKGKSDERSSMIGSYLEETKKELDRERSKTVELNSELARVKTESVNLEKKLEEQKSDIAELQQKFINEFENLANKILDDKSKKFTEQNKENISAILDPLRQKITEFEKKVNDVYVSDNQQRAALGEQLRNLQELNKVMSEEASNLTKALKGDTKQQGAWGEFILESILEKSGLEKGREFVIQETIKNEEGSRRRPDVIINLPDNKSIIIDSKVSLKAYEAYSSSDNDETRKSALAAHVSSVKKHIKELSPKEYQNLYSLESLDFVLMFIPIEPAFALAVQNEPNIFNDAFDKNIVLVSPSTLLATLRTIASIWKQEKQNRNALEIARQSGALYDKFVGFVEDLINIGKRIDSTKESYTDAMRKLYEGSGNLISRIENIKQLGAKSTKNLPNTLLDRADDVENLRLFDPNEEKA
jgi:DNA recombination protein RmuC